MIQPTRVLGISSSSASGSKQRRLHSCFFPGAGLGIVDINNAYAQVTMTKAADLRGNPLFDVFPDNPDDPLADGVSNLHAALSSRP